MDTCLASVVGASYYWCQTSIHHVHWDGYWDVGQCVWRIAGTGGEVQPLSGDWRLRWVLLNWLGVTCGAFQPVACVVAPSARGQEDEYYPYWGGDSIISSEQADIGHSDILSRSWIFSDTNLSPGSGQSEYGRSFQGSGVKGVVPESLGGQQNTQVDLFASCESAHLPVYFSIYRKDRRAEGSMLWFRGGNSRRSMCFHLPNWFYINMHGNQGLSGMTDIICI